jgi:hypothetical protein
MDIKGHGSFIRIDYEGKRYFRLCEGPGYNWYEYEFFANSMQLLTNEGVMKFELAMELETQFKALFNNNPVKTEINNKKVLTLIADAIKNRKDFDSGPYQPNNDKRFIVKSDKDQSFLKIIQKSNNQEFLIGSFTDSNSFIYYPNESLYGRSSRARFINSLLSALNDKFDNNNFNYRYKETSNSGKIEICVPTYDPEHKNIVFKKIIPFSNPLVIPLAGDT